MKRTVRINGRRIGPGQPTYIVAELSANHGQSFEEAVKLVRAAKEAGADAVKLQTYTPDTMTLDSTRKEFQISGGTLWDGQTLYDLYAKAYTPWDWQPKLKEVANEIGIDLFSSPFDQSAVDFLSKMDVPAYKVASFELVDIPLLEYIGTKGRPVIISTGMATFDEITSAIQTLEEGGTSEIVLLKCTSAYPAPPEDMNLRTIPDLAERTGCPVGLSDHTLGASISIASVSLGACLIEKHFTLSRAVPGPDSPFSIEPEEFRDLVQQIRIIEKGLGQVNYQPTKREEASRAFRRSLFVVKNIRAGDRFTKENVRSIRPSLGLAPCHFRAVLGMAAAKDIAQGTPLQWHHIEGKETESL